jgi:hypothetical protein
MSGRYDEYGFYIEDDELLDGEVKPVPTVHELPEVPHLPIRQHFPAAGEEVAGGVSDGWEYRTVFGGSRLEQSYAMVQQFLQEEGYADIPIPRHADELKLFRKQRTPQLQLFPERGYVHNPIKILFHPDSKQQRNTLILCLYNETDPEHLLKFHGIVKR